MKEQWENLDLLREPLLDWYAAHRRILPWREQPSPYRTWVSEIMLQQTRVTAVIPYFERFMAELPDVYALSAVSEDRLFKLWEGLGYYSRARNLHRAAKMIVSEFGGELPPTVEALRKLPGIGDYTASAIASINFAAAEPAVDGNLLRVAARLVGCGDDITDSKVKKRFRDIMSISIDRGQPGQWNQAMMDLGATVCLPNGAPLCAECPGRSFCVAYREQLTAVLPVRAEKRKRRAEERTVFVLQRNGEIALHQRPDSGLLAKLMEFPNVLGNLDEGAARLQLAQWGLDVRDLSPCGTARHTFTHIEWQMKGYVAEVEGSCADLRWIGRKDLDSLAIPTAFRVFTEIARNCLV